MDEISNFVKAVLTTSPRYSSFIVEFNNGDKFKRFTQSCYGFIEEFCVDEDVGIISLTVFHPWEKFNREVVEFILNEEPFSKYFITKDIDKGRMDGFIVDLSHPYEEILGAMIALRGCWNNYNGSLFPAFRKAGASIVESMFLSERFHLDDNLIFMGGYAFDHDIFPMSVCLKDLIKLDYESTSDLTAIDSGSLYNSVWVCWKNQTGNYIRNCQLFTAAGATKDNNWSSVYMFFNETNISNLYKTFKEE
jgi:hypothetical protein